MAKTVHVVGGGLAGTEAAWQALRAGAKVVMHEMRPKKQTPAHQTGELAELVCSNSLKSMSEGSVPGLLKLEMAALNSLVVSAAYEAKVPAGGALAVDRTKFSFGVSEALKKHANFTMLEEEVCEIPIEGELSSRDEVWIIASGPLTGDALASQIARLCGGNDRLYFYDAIAPIIAADSIDLDECFVADRYDRGDGDYLNLPLSRDQYEAFISDVESAEKMPLHQFENTSYFEACLPIEVMVERGRETLRFGPLKPVGLVDPNTGKTPYACVQLRQENVGKTMYSMVGFQTKMRWPEQKRVFSKLSGLKNAEFFRYGSVHRNTYVQGPKVLAADLAFRSNSRVFLAGQITGVEGYTESAAIGLLAGRFAAKRLGLLSFDCPPQGTVLGALAQYVTSGPEGKYSPMNANFGLLPPMKKERGVSKAEKKLKQCAAAQSLFKQYLENGRI